MLNLTGYGAIRDVVETINRYVEHGCQPGDFVLAVLENNLREAFMRADNYNTAHMQEIVRYCYNEIPGAAWGSPEKVRLWLEEVRKLKGGTN